MNKHELKSLLENIYEAMILPSLADQALSNPSLLNPSQPLSPTPPVAPTQPPPVPRPRQLPNLVKPERGDDPALLEEINRLLDMLRQLELLGAEQQGQILQALGIGNMANLRARIQQLLEKLIRARQPLTA